MLSNLFCAVYLYCLLRMGWFSWCCTMIPNRLSGPFIWSGLLYQLFERPAFLSCSIKGVVTGYLGMLIVYWLCRVTYRRELLTYGDIKIFAGLGAWYGWEDLPQLLLITVVSHGTLATVSIKGEDPQRCGISLVTAGVVKLILECV